MSSGSDDYTIVFNGEVYNHPELRAELASHGATFRSGTDTEVLLAGFERWGVPETLARTVGMFAIAAWDARTRSVWLARDRVGIKPLFLYRSGETLAFASEIKSFRSLADAKLSVDPTVATAFLALLYVPAPRSIFREVTKVTPGTWLRIGADDHSITHGSFWSLGECVRRGREAPFAGSEEEATEECRRLIEDSVRLRLRSDVPLGAFLSGGIDSSTVVAVAQSVSPEPIRTFTVSFDDEQLTRAATRERSPIVSGHAIRRFGSRWKTY
jgi:asparagine synthase (glutamine-hydrolysing)